MENRASVLRMGGEYTGTFTGGHRIRDVHIAPVDGDQRRRTPAAHAPDVQTVDANRRAPRPAVAGSRDDHVRIAVAARGPPDRIPVAARIATDANAAGALSGKRGRRHGALRSKIGPLMRTERHFASG